MKDHPDKLLGYLLVQVFVLVVDLEKFTQISMLGVIGIQAVY
jgi:hypothetical protein